MQSAHFPFYLHTETRLFPFHCIHSKLKLAVLIKLTSLNIEIDSASVRGSLSLMLLFV